ncbi:hypothetical protein W02_01360 [Nitrospira sp. KM1]|uniref:alginate export family protein n=1 Tax=Nitrospira sp. KM1 TaxID=1936990 RepID=UPI0013A71436|nr:alginate export family protein [Nitrospira sp. KM1]BCA52996.1 hypothetical protein W02_01360 [Nitrospira sp. KM1]
MLGLFYGFLSPGLGYGQSVDELQDLKDRLQQQQAERDDLQRRIERLERANAAQASAAPPPVKPPDPWTSFHVNIRKPEQLRPYNPVACVGLLECFPEPQLYLDAPKKPKEVGWELELQIYNRFQFNLYDNFSDTRNAPGSTPGNRTFVNNSSCSFNTSCREDQRMRFFNWRGYLTTAIKNGPFQVVLLLDYAGDQFNDGVLLGNDAGPLGAAGQRQFIVNPQLLYIEYDDWLKVRAGRQYARLGNGIVAQSPRDMITAGRNWTDTFNTTLVWVLGSAGRSIPNQPGPTFAPQGTNIPGLNQTTQTSVNDVTGKEEDLDGFGLVFNYTPIPLNRLQFFAWALFDTTAAGVNKQNRYFDLNGSGKLGLLDYSFEGVYLWGTSPVTTTAAAGGVPGTRQDYSDYLGYLDLKYHVPSQALPFVRDNLLSLGTTFGIGSKNFDALFLDETAFRYNFFFSDDIHGYNGRPFDTRRGSGFSNTTFIQPYLIVKPLDKLQTKVSWTYLRATEAQPAGTGALGPTPFLTPALSYSSTGVGGPTKDIGQEFDVLTDYFFNPAVRLFANFGIFLPGRLYAPFADNAVKFQTGIEYRF